MSHHGIVKCEKCHGVILQCRCMGPHETIYRGKCQTCRKEEIALPIILDNIKHLTDPEGGDAP